MYLITYYSGKEREVHARKLTFSKRRALEAIRDWDKTHYDNVASYEVVAMLC